MKFRLKAASGPWTGQTFDLVGQKTSIGSDQDQDVVIDALAPKHAIIHLEDGALRIEAMGTETALVYLNGTPISNGQVLNSGDEIRLGEVRFVLQAPGLKPQRVLHTTGQKKRIPWGWIGLGALGLGAAGVAFVHWQYPSLLEPLMQWIGLQSPGHNPPGHNP